MASFTKPAASETNDLAAGPCEASGFRGYLCKMFAIDLRTLALFRILLGSLLLIDICRRWFFIEMLYTDAGVFSRSTLEQILGSSVKWTSLHYYTGGNSTIQSLLFLEAAVCAVLLLLGCRTWLLTLISWVLFVSLNRRVPNGASGADIILRILLFWCLFLPLGARWSIDRALDSGNQLKQSLASNRFASVATGAILLQVCYIYWFTVLLKLHPDWLAGRALGNALHLDTFARPFAFWLREKESLTTAMTYGTLAVEAVAPIVALCPWLNAWMRWIAILSMWGLHLGIALCMNIGLFPYVSMLCWVLFIPSETWDWLDARLGKSSLANSLQNIGAHIGAAFAKFVPRRPLAIQPTAWVSSIVAATFLFVTLYNVLGLVNRIPRPMKMAAKLVRLDQQWSMFADTEKAMDGWFTIPCKLSDGSVVDVWQGGVPFSREKPELVSATYPNFRVNRLMNNNRMSGKKAEAFWRGFTTHIVNNWNDQHPPEKAIKEAKVIYLHETEHDQPPTPLMLAQIQFN